MRVAHGHLAFERAGESTALRSAYAESPLRLLTPRNHGNAAWVYATTLGGGLLDGDCVRLRIEVGERARALVTTQGPTRVFRCAGGAASETFARVDEGASLVLAPAPAACFAGARFEQRTEVDVAPGATLAFWDVLSAGRDRWGFARVRSAIAVRVGGRAVIDEALLLDAAHGALPERLGRFGALATLVLVGRSAPADPEPLRPGAKVLQSVSMPGAGTTVVRLAGERVELVLEALRTHLGEVLGDDPWRLDAPHAA